MEIEGFGSGKLGGQNNLPSIQAQAYSPTARPPSSLPSLQTTPLKIGKLVANVRYKFMGFF
jgi:hypothetical protein